MRDEFVQIKGMKLNRRDIIDATVERSSILHESYYDYLNKRWPKMVERIFSKRDAYKLVITIQPPKGERKQATFYCDSKNEATQLLNLI